MTTKKNQLLHPVPPVPPAKLSAALKAIIAARTTMTRCGEDAVFRYAPVIAAFEVARANGFTPDIAYALLVRGFALIRYLDSVVGWDERPESWKERFGPIFLRVASVAPITKKTRAFNPQDFRRRLSAEIGRER